MENKILIYKDDKAIKDTKHQHDKIKVNLQRIADALKDVSIEPTYNLVTSVVIRFDGKSPLLNDIFNKRVKLETQTVPALEAMIKDKYDRCLNSITELGKNAYKSIYEYSVSPFFNPNPPKIDRFVIDKGKVSITPEGLEEIEDECSVYIDTENRIQVYEKAQKVIDSIKDLQESLDSVPKKGLDQYTRLYAVSPLETSSISILAVDHDGKVKINNSSFDFIV